MAGPWKYCLAFMKNHKHWPGQQTSTDCMSEQCLPKGRNQKEYIAQFKPVKFTARLDNYSCLAANAFSCPFLSHCQDMLVSSSALGRHMLLFMFISFSGFGLLGDLESSPKSEPCDITTHLSKIVTPVVFHHKLSIALEFKDFPCQ